VAEMIPITLFLSIAAVLILRPVTKRLGLLLEAMAREREPVRAAAQTDSRIVGLLEHMNKRLELMEERLDFTERLVARPRPSGRRATQQSDIESDAGYLVP
jgi:hypothetical protein